jgi:hypothetical protein
VASADTQRKLDPNKLDFRLLFEVKGRDAATLGRALAGAGLQGWTATAIAARDCSHEKLGDGGWQGYVRIWSPIISIQNGGLDGVEKALSTIQGTGAVPGKTGAMRFMFRRDALDDKATTNLIRMTAANEDILYRLGQHGQEGRELSHKVGYAATLSQIAPQNYQTSDQWAAALRAKLGFRQNDEDPKNWEMRYLDSVFDGPAVANTLHLMCGMVSAAAEGTTQWSGSHPAQAGVQVDRPRWNAFMREAAPPAIRPQLEDQFRKAGGVMPAGLTDAGAKATGQLLSLGYACTAQNGTRLGSADAVRGQVDGSESVVVTTPQNIQARLSPEQFGNFVMAESGNTAELPNDIKAKLTELREVQAQGISFGDVNGTPVLVSDLAVRPDDTGIVAKSASGQVSLGDTKFGLKELKAALNPAHASHASLKTAVGGGYQMMADGVPVTWGPQLAAGLVRGTLVASKDGMEKKLTNEAELETNVLQPIFVAGMAPEAQAQCQAAEALTAKGFQFTAANQALKPGTLAFARSLSASPEDLKVLVPGARQYTPLATPALLRTFLAVETGDDAALSQATRHQLDLVKGLSDKGYQFSNPQTESPITSRSGAILSLQTPSHTLLVQVPGGERRIPVQESTLEDLTQFEQGTLRAPLADAVDLHSKLQAGTTIQMQDPDNQDKFVSCKPAELVATLSQNRTVGLLNSAHGMPIADADPSRTMLTGAEAFVAGARERIAGSTPDAEQQGAMQGFQELIAAGATAKVDATGRAIAQSSLVPWLLHDNAGFKVKSAPGSVGSVHVSNWTELHKLVDVEAERTSEANQATVADARLVSNLRKNDVKFYTVKADKKAAPLGLKSAVLDQMKHDGVQVRVPGLGVWWGWHPSKKFTIHTSEELQKLSDKFQAPVQTLFA